jgi:ubiquitin C
MFNKRKSGPLSPRGKKQVLKIPEESRREVLVYHKPGKKDPEIKFVESEIQGIWADSSSVHTSPCVIWAFLKDSIPEGFNETEHTQGVWGYKPGVDPEDPLTTQATDMLFFSPGTKLPKGLNEKGMWTFPLVERDISHLKDHETAFLKIGKARPTEEMDVGGTWKLLYKNDGSDQPIGPGMKSKTEKIPPPMPMKITIRTPEGKNIDLDVLPTDTIDELKDKVLDKTGIPKEDQRLTFDGNELPDPTTLADNKIEDGDVIDLDPMQIIVKHWDGSTFPLIVKPDDDIDSVKSKIQKHKKIPKRQQRLRFQDTPLTKDNGTLKDYDIKHKSIVELDPMQIKVRTPDGEVIEFTVNPEDTIKDVKDKVAEKTGIPVPNQMLNFDGEELDDKPTLDECNINHGDTLDLEVMQIYVKHWDGSTITLDVTPNDTLGSVKSTVNEKTGVPKKQQRLTFEGKPLKKDKKTLKDYKIKNQDTLILEPMQVNVKTPDGKTLSFQVEPTDTIEDVKKKVEDEIGMPVPDQRMLFEGEELNDPATLDDYNIKNGDTLFLDPMKIHVKHWDGKIITLDVQPDDTIDDIKTRVEEKEDIPKDQQRLTFEGQLLDEDDKTLRDYGVKHESTLNLEPMQINVKTPDGKTIPVQVEPNDTVEDVKKKVEDKTGIAVPDQTLLFDGDELDDPTTLADNNIKHGDTLTLAPMQIYVKHWDGSVITLDVQPDDTIGDIKSKVSDEKDVPPDQQRLTFNDKPLKKDKKTLRDYKIKNKDTIVLEPMQIFVKMPDGKMIPIDVEPSDTIWTVKKKVEDETGFPVPNQTLRFDGDELGNPTTLTDNGIKHGATLDLDPMKIFVKKPDGTKIELTVSPSDTIANVKGMVEDKEGIPVDDQNMEFDGKDLEDGPTLLDYHIKDGDTIDLVPMEIIVRHWNNAIFYFEVDPDNTIDMIKDLVEKRPPKLAKETQKMAFKDLPINDDDKTLRDYSIKHRDVIQLVKPPAKQEPKKKSYLPENWKEEVEKKYGTVRTTTYATDYSGDTDESFLRGKIGETEEEFEFIEEVTREKDGVKTRKSRMIKKD